MIRPKNVGENMEIFEAFIYICGAKFKPHKLEWETTFTFHKVFKQWLNPFKVPLETQN